MEPFNPLDPTLATNPYPAYAKLREGDRVHLSAIGAHLLTHYEDVKRMLNDGTTFQHQYVAQQRQRGGEQVEDEPYFDYFRRMIFVSDGEHHRRLRKLVAKAFTPRQLTDLRHKAERIASELYAAGAKNGGMDFVSEFALPFPLRVIGSMLGIPDADHAAIGEHATALNPVLEFLPMSPDVLATANHAVEVLAEYFVKLAEERRRNPTDDLFSALVHATEDGDTLSNEELIANAILLYVAGHETTAGGTSLALYSLHNNPEQLTYLKQNLGSIPGAIDELLRYDTPGQGTARVIMQETLFGDHRLEPGNVVLGYIGAANRDPSIFDAPDALNFQRDFTRTRPLTFGGGAHMCVGRNLARQEFEVAFTALFTEHPSVRVVEAGCVFRDTPLMRGLKELPIEW